jgi:multiple sugar transport system permease protein
MTRHDRWLAYLFVAPAIMFVAVLMYYPMLGSAYESLFTTSFISPNPRFIGLASYSKVFSDPVFLQVLLNSLEWTGLVVLLQNLVGFAVALLLNQNLPGQGLMRSLILLPWILPGVVAAIVWRFMCDPQLGLINSLLVGCGLTNHSIAWLGDVHTAMPAAIGGAVWKGFPYSSVVYLAALQNVDQEQVEAAIIDGASALRRLFDIVLPAIRPVIGVNVLLTTILTFNYFDMIWVLTRGGPENSTHIFPTKIYELGFGQFRFGEASVYGVISVLVLVVFIATFLAVQCRPTGRA